LIRFKIKPNRKFLTMLLLIFLFYYTFLAGEDTAEEIHKRGLKAVQLWTPKFGSKTWEFAELGEKPFESCPEKRCFAFRSSKTLPNEASHAVMVHASDLSIMPDRSVYKRNPRQIWSFVTIESQAHSFRSNRFNLTDLDDWFNLTMTFKSDSDHVIEYRSFKDWNSIYQVPWYMNAFVEFRKLVPTLDSYKQHMTNYVGSFQDLVINF
jgi:hypothetical protein